MGCGARIKDYIYDHDISQKALAHRLGVLPATLNNYLNERTSLPTELLPEIANALNVSGDFLLGLTDIPDSPYHVSSSERKLIEQFRTLSREQKELILQSIALMCRQNERG